MKAYELHWEYRHLVDENEDCSVIEFEGLEELRFKLGGIEKCSTDKKIILQGNFSIIPNISDFPVNDIGIPLMSRKMISILEEDKLVTLNKLDVIIIDDAYLGSLFNEVGDFMPGLSVNNGYQFIQVLNFTKVFDRNNSTFKILKSNPDKIGVISKLVLSEPINGFPSIFRIEEKPSLLFINEATKIKFEQIEIKGCLYKEVITAKS